MRGYFILQGKNIYGRVGVLIMAKQVKSKYTDVPVKDISNGVIVLDNNQKVTGVKIMPKNIFNILLAGKQSSGPAPEVSGFIISEIFASSFTS